MAIVEHDNPELRASARMWAGRWPVTGNPSDALITFYTLPEEVRGLKVVDLCSGTSDLTASLIDRGADAYAFDILYSDIEWLLERRRHKYISTYVEGDIKNDHSLYQRAVEDLESTGTYRGFMRSLKDHPQRYIDGSVHALPFADGSFDYALSFNGILGVTQEDYALCLRSIQEAIRVVKTGGQVQLGPMMSVSQKKEGKENQEKIITDLEHNPSVQVLRDKFPFHGYASERLTVVKQ